MYRKKDNQQTIEDFILPFDGALAADNRWVIKAQMIPWDDIEGDYSDLFPSDTGNVAKPARVAFGALIIKETLGVSDEETVAQIQENPYLQYFLGFKQYTNKKPFDPSLMVRFRAGGRQEMEWYLVRWGDQVEAQFLAASGDPVSDTTESDAPQE